MDEKLENLINIYDRTQKEILEEISKLECSGSECHCVEGEVEYFEYVHYTSESDEIIILCLECGGRCI